MTITTSYGNSADNPWAYGFIAFPNKEAPAVNKLSQDLAAFHDKFGFNKDWKPTKHNLRQRVDVMAREELDEALEALDNNDVIGFIDALVDLVYFTLGTADLMGIDFDAHWQAVQDANMSKVRGTKASRPDTGGLDVIKPEGWVSPESRHEAILAKQSKPFKFID